MSPFKRAWGWLVGQRPLDLGYMPLSNKHVRMLVYLGELRAKGDNSSCVHTHAKVVGDRVVEAREAKVAAAATKPKLQVLKGKRW